MHGPMYTKKKYILLCISDVFCRIFHTLGALLALLFIYCRKVIFFLWRCDPILGHSLPLRGFTITLIGHTTLGRPPLDA